MAKSVGEFILILDKFTKAVDSGNLQTAYAIRDEIVKEIEALLERIEQLEKEQNDQFFNDMMSAVLGNSE